MPLHGKIVVIKRSGGDGTEFPLTTTCLFGRKPDCDIRIQLPQVSKEHCRIDYNENKEIILTNLSSVNPTRVNGEALQQSERLKHGDVITVIDRSFRFEYPPAPTPKKRSSLGAKTETFKVLQNQQVGDTVTTETGERGISELSTDPHLKDGTNHENIQRPLEEDGLLQNKTASPFNDLYQMIKKSLDVKTPRKSSASVLQTPTSRFCTPKPVSVRKNDDKKPVIPTEDKITPKKDEAKVSSIADETMEEAGNVSNETPKSVKKQPLQVPSTEVARPEVDEAENADQSEVTPQKRTRTPPKRFTACEAVELISASPKSPVRRTSPRNSGKVEAVKETSKKRKSEELATDLPTSQMKRKRVSFGGFLCPELFDKRLPPNSPLCKGATPRRSLTVTKPKQSLLRRASAMGLIQDKRENSVSPKRRTPSPKSSRSKSPSPARGRSPTVQGRFSVSHISTPEDAVTEEVALVFATPKIPPRRRSTLREAPSHAKILCKNSGISRASMKVKNSWADIVRFGHARAQVAVPAKKNIAKKTMKKTVSKPQTPARNLKGHVSTGHADSPVTIVVGRAHKQKVVLPTGAAPKLVTNIALIKKHMKMDEDLTGISEMLKTPVNERRKTSVINENNAPKTLVGSLGTFVVEPSVLNTPEESGEMMVSPLTVSSSVKDRSYNSEAVQRLFDNDHESSIDNEDPVSDDSSEQQCTDLKTTSVATPKHKPELPECLTGVKRIMKTPKQKAEPIDDLRGKILKTPKQELKEQECLTGVKRIMKTPKQKAEPLEDLRGKILKTPKQKPEEQECLTGVKRMMETPKQEAEPVDDIKVELLASPQPEAEPQPLEDQGNASVAETNEVADQAPLDCDEDIAKELVFAHEEPREDVPTDVVHDVPADVVHDVPADVVHDVPADVVHDVPADVVHDVPADVVHDVPADVVHDVPTDVVHDVPTDVVHDVPTDVVHDVPTDVVHDVPTDVVHDVPTDVVHDVPQVDMETEADANEVVVDDHLEELPSGPYDNQPSDAVEISQAAVDENFCVEKTDVVEEKLSEDQPDVESATIEVTEMDTTESLVADAAEDCNEAVVPTPVRGRRGKKSEAAAPTAVRQTTRGRNAKSQGSPSDDQPGMAPEKALLTTLVTEISTEAVSDQTSPITENDSTPTEEAVVKPTRGRKSKQTPVGPPQPEPELNEVVADGSQPQMSRRGRKPKPDTVEQKEVAGDAVVAVETKQQSQAPVRAKRGRNAKQEEEKQESVLVETTRSQEPVKKLRKSKKTEQNKASGDQAEIVPEPESQQSPPVDVNHDASDSAAALEKAALKPKRGRKAKQPEKSATEQQDGPSSQSEDVPQADMTKEADESEVGSVKVTEMDAAVQKKSGRGRRAKLVESNSAEDKPETTEAVLPTLVRGRRGKKTEATAPPTDNDATPTEEEAVVKPTRGRKSKQTSVELPQPELNEVVADESQPQKSRRGRKPKLDTVEQNEVEKDAVVHVEIKQQSQAPVRAKRGRNAKQEEEEKLKSTAVETTRSEEPAKKLRRTKKAEQDHGEPREEVQAIEMVVPEEAEAPLVAEPVKMEERAAKPRRGGRKAAEVPADDATAEIQKRNSEPDAPVVKQSRARGAKTSVKNEVSQAIPAKKTRRGAVLPLEETNAESTVQGSEPATTSVEPARRGRRAAAKAPAIDATVSSDPAKLTEESSKAVQDTKTSKRFVKWKADLEETPVKAVRGRKANLGGQVDTESKTVSKAAQKTEEMDLSDEVVEAQPAKRTRKGPKVAAVTAEEAVPTSKVQSVDAEAQPKTRRGRSAKK
ncbi:proliferation marker protein Ki-67 [Clinocottus analis]|uniref:proliferation marker protein Ki-67 n=1 Tax=Clinocottus analis TaxID=304258 RepID=UPI0035C0589A